MSRFIVGVIFGVGITLTALSFREQPLPVKVAAPDAAVPQSTVVVGKKCVHVEMRHGECATIHVADDTVTFEDQPIKVVKKSIPDSGPAEDRPIFVD